MHCMGCGSKLYRDPDDEVAWGCRWCEGLCAAMENLGMSLATAGALTEARNRGYTEGESAGFDMGYMDACNGRAGC